jgi:hypothetical protein
MGVQLHIAHHFGEGVPLDLCEREKNVLVGQQRMLATARFFGCAIDDALRGFANLVR